MRTPASASPTAVCLAVAALAGCAAPNREPAQAPQPEVVVIKGAVAYTDVLRYDYTGDGKRNRIRFWMEFDGHSARGTPGSPDYRPAGGTMRYFLRDEDDGTKVLKWRQGLDMAGVPRDVPVPMTDLEFDGKTARFEAFGVRWTITDGGDGYQHDKIFVNDGFREVGPTPLYAGNLWIGPPRN
jgi:hypothetical protein